MALLSVAGAGASLLGGSKAAPLPPPVAAPAPPAPTAREPGAQVKVGTPDTATTDALMPEYSGFAEKRVSGKSLGGLGRGGLGL